MVPSLANRLIDEDVISNTCEQIKQLDGFSKMDVCKDNENIIEILNIFPQRIKHSPVFFSHKIADSISLPLPWLLGILGLGDFPLEEENSFIANDHVKNGKEKIWVCIRGPYKSHSESLQILFDHMFSGSFRLKTSMVSKFIKKIKKHV